MPFQFVNRVPHGFGLFIWLLDKAGGVDAVIARCHQLAIDGIFLKAADGDSLWGHNPNGAEQFTPAVLQAFHAAGISVVGWQYVYGGPGNGAPAWSSVQGEIDAANWILDQGPDGYCFDDEVEMDGKPQVALAQLRGIRAKHPTASVGYNPYPYPSADVSHPFFEYNSGCDYVMPQLYQRQDWNIAPADALAKMEADFPHWSAIWAARPDTDPVTHQRLGRPCVPILIDWQYAQWGGRATPLSDIIDAARLTVSHHYPLMTGWDWDALTADEWTAVGQASAIFHEGEPMTALDRVLPSAQRNTEFVLDPSTGKWLTGDCGPDSLTEAEDTLRRVPINTADVVATVHRMESWGGADPNGVTWVTQWPDGTYHSTLAQQAEKDGFQVVYKSNWTQNPMPRSAWEPVLRQYAGLAALVIGFDNGQALRDWRTGQGENATGLKGHVIFGAGLHLNGGAGDKMPDGIYAGDGDNYDAGNVLQFYPFDVLEAAQLSEVIVLALPGWIGGPQTVTIVLEKDSAGTIIGAHDDTTKQHVGGGLATDIAKFGNGALLSDDLTLGETYLTGPNGQKFSVAVVGHRYPSTWSGGPRTEDWYEVAQAIEVALGGEQAAQAADKSAQAADTADKATIAQLQAQVTQLQQQLAAAQQQGGDQGGQGTLPANFAQDVAALVTTFTTLQQDLAPFDKLGADVAAAGQALQSLQALVPPAK